MGWFCNCPRCRLAEWDFQTQGDPQGDQWENDGNYWHWTPDTADRIGGYRIVAAGLRFMSVRIRFANGLELPLHVDYEYDSAGNNYYLTVGDHDYVIAATEPLPSIPDAIRLDLCYWQPTRHYRISATLYDADQHPIGNMHATIPGAATNNPIAFAPPTISIPIGADYVAIDGLQESVQGCCDLCRRDNCLTLQSLPTIHSGGRALLYGTPQHLQLQIQIPAATKPWLIIDIGECCDDNGTLTGTTLHIDASLQLSHLIVSWSDCTSYHGNGGSKFNVLAPIKEPWADTPRDYTFTLCVHDYETETVVSLSAADGTGKIAYSSVELNTWLKLFERKCYPEFQGTADPATVFDLDGGYVVQAFASDPIRPSPGRLDPCYCPPIPGPLTRSICDDSLCPEGDAPQGWIAEVTGLPLNWITFNGAYVLKPGEICAGDWKIVAWPPLPSECAELIFLQPLALSPTDPDYIFQPTLENYMTQNYPGVTDYPNQCQWAASRWITAPNGTTFAFCLQVYRPISPEQYEQFQNMPVLVHASILRYDPLTGVCEGCEAETINMMIGTIPVPMCPNWPSIAPIKLQEYKRDELDDPQCEAVTPSFDPQISISPIL